jgi:hypothetical protein
MFAGDHMGEGLHGETLRDVEAALAAKAPEAPVGPEAFTAAIAGHASRQNPEAPRQLAALLGRRALLLETRAEPSTSSIITGCCLNTSAIIFTKRGRDYRFTNYLMRRQALKFSSRIVNDQRTVCRNDT